MPTPLSHPPLLVLCHHAEDQATLLTMPLRELFSGGELFTTLGRDDLRYVHAKERGACATVARWLQRHPDGVVVFNGANVFRAWPALRLLLLANGKYRNRQVAYWREGATILRDMTGLEGPSRLRRMGRRLRFAVVRRLLTNNRTWHVVNSKQCKQLILYLFGIGADRIYVSGSTTNVQACPTGDRFHERPDIRVCMAGDLYHHKGYDLFARIAAEFRACNGRELRYTWYGGNPDWIEQVRKRLFVNGGLDERVTYAGYMRPLVDAMVHDDIFLLTSREESFGVAALEALACDLPVFCFDSVGIAEILPDEFVCSDRADMIDKLRHYLGRMTEYPSGCFRAIAMRQSPEGRYGEAWKRLFARMATKG